MDFLNSRSDFNKHRLKILKKHCEIDPQLFEDILLQVETLNRNIYRSNNSLLSQVNPKALFAYMRWMNERISETARKADAKAAYDVRKICLSFTFHHTDMELLSLVLKWNELKPLDDHRYDIGVSASDKLSCHCESLKKDAWYIEFSFGYRQLISDTINMFFLSLTDSNKLDIKSHIENNVSLACQGKMFIPYKMPIRQAMKTELFSLLVRLYVICHELGHILARSQGMKFNTYLEEEKYADIKGAELYLSTAMMFVSPSREKLLAGKLKSASENRAFMKEYFEDSYDSVKDVYDELVRKKSMSDSILVRIKDIINTSSKKPNKKTISNALENVTLWAAPLFSLELVSLIERHSPIHPDTNQTHPAASERIENYWRRSDMPLFRQLVEQRYGGAFSELFR